MNDSLTFNKIYFYIWLLIPITLITGPAIPDILLVIFCLIFFFELFTKSINIKLIDEKWMIILILLWIWFIFISFFAYDFNLSISDALIFIRFIVFIFKV